MVTREQFATDWLAGLGVPPYEGGLVALVNLMYAEGSRAANNPDDTTQSEPGATLFNTFDGSLHVWNFPTYEEGITAAVQTMRNGNNTEVVNALTARLSAEVVTEALISHSSWSSAGALYRETLPHTQQNFKEVASVQVAGSQAQPAEGTPSEEHTETPAEEHVEDPPAPPAESEAHETDIPLQPPDTEVAKVEDAIAAQAKVVDADAVAGKAAALRATIAQLETHLSELEALVQ